MARTAETIDHLVAQDSDMEEAIETVLATAEEHGTFSWGDVSNSLTTEQWAG